jgi:hypothetical protein
MPMMGMIDPSSAGTLTRVKTIETFVDNVFVTVSERFTIVGCFLCFGEDG